MNKLLLLALLTLVVYSQPPPSPGGMMGSSKHGSMDNKSAPATPTPDQSNEEMHASMMAMVEESPPQNWYCDFEFYYNGSPYFYENLSYDSTEAYHAKFSKKWDNKIDSIYWSGTRCYCWVVVYQSKYWEGLNLGLWIDSDSGYYDLSRYITYDWNTPGWEPWSTVVSSYAIYCY